MLVVWHGASEVMGGLLVALAPNVVSGLIKYTNYALNLIHDFVGTTDQLSPRNSPHVAEMCPPALETGKGSCH